MEGEKKKRKKKDPDRVQEKRLLFNSVVVGVKDMMVDCSYLPIARGMTDKINIPKLISRS